MAKKEDTHKINKRITAVDVRLVGDNVDTGIYSIEEALELANDLNLDLVEISANAAPPVCKIIDYKKFVFDEKKKKKDNQAQKTIIKEVRFTPNTGEHDFEFKKKHAINFLENSNKVKASVFFKGREIKFKEQGEILLLKLATDLEGIGVPEALPRMEGKYMSVMFAPKKKK